MVSECQDLVSPAQLYRVPGEVALVYDFVNSIDERTYRRQGRRRTGSDWFAGPEELRAWSRARSDLPDDPPVESVDLDLAVALRALLRDAIAAHSGAAELDPAAFGEVSTQLPLAVAADPGGGLTVRPIRPGVQGALAQILAQAVTATLSGHWSRLKMCDSPECRWIFYDRSRPGTRRWCASDICGNRAKKAAQRQRS